MYSYNLKCVIVDLNQAKEFRNMHHHTSFYIHFCIKKHIQVGVWLLYLSFQNHNTQTGTGKFICNVSLLDVKELLLKPDRLRSHISQSTTRTAFLAKMSCSNYPAILEKRLLNRASTIMKPKNQNFHKQEISIFYRLAS